MSRRAATVEVEERLLDALKRAATDEGVAPDELVELIEEDAMDLAVAEVRAQRAERRNAS